jgi:Phage integrase family
MAHGTCDIASESCKKTAPPSSTHASKHLGRSADFSNIFEVKRCRASFMQAVNRDRFSAHSRTTLTAFVEGAYLPWTKEVRRASTSKGHHEIWINHIRDHVGEIRLLIPALAEILEAYRTSAGNPEFGSVFRSDDGLPISLDKVVRRMIRPALVGAHLPWYGWHAFRRGLASNLYALGAPDKVVQRILRHSKPHVTRERYIKVFDRTVLEAVEKVQARIEELRQAKVGPLQLQLKFGDPSSLRATDVAESPTGRGLSHFSTDW